MRKIIFLFLIFTLFCFSEIKVFKFLYTENPVKIDGNLDEWDKEKFSDIKIEDEVFGKVSGKWDKDYIYLAFIIYDTSPMKNSGDDPKTCFKYGDTVEFFICTDKNYIFKDEISESHYRIIMTYLKDKKTIYCFKPVDKYSKEPVYFSSPATSIKIDWTGYVLGSDMEIKREKDLYILEVKIPVSFFKNFNIEKGMRVSGDFAINFSDESGTINVLKVYWNQEYGGIVNDIPTEQRLEPDRWGIFEFYK
ncbi:MAG: hypothetical protein NC827_04265 [Candidatus Omnitrophica bacterium]|nr:hypothetical protein [Candidatus Omnitrophota bacterium]MCM8802506.1 hypothetical protein [Candidatus Omnitrophota bacterium]